MQSYIWNRIATERITRWGLRPMKGDLYLRKCESGSDDEDAATAANVQVVEDPSGVDIFDIVLPVSFCCECILGITLTHRP